MPGQETGGDEYPGNDQKFRQARHEKHRFALAFFQDPVSLPDQDVKTRDTGGGTGKGNYTILGVFCKKKISSTASGFGDDGVANDAVGKAAPIFSAHGASFARTGCKSRPGYRRW